jgi:hypothetical protein
MFIYNFAMPRFLCVLFQINTITDIAPVHLNLLWNVPWLHLYVDNMQVLCHLWYTNKYLGSRQRSYTVYIYIYIYIYIRLKIKPNSVRIRFYSCHIFVLPSTGFAPTPLLHCSTIYINYLYLLNTIQWILVTVPIRYVIFFSFELGKIRLQWSKREQTK